MTRINVGIRASVLTDKHLMAEHREIKRIPNCIVKGRYNMKGQPSVFTLGTGHVKFFYDKCGYLLKRYRELYEECKHRGFNVTDYSGAWDLVPDSMMGEYQPTNADRKIIEARIKERLSGGPTKK